MRSELNNKCGCGKPIKYMHHKDGKEISACNKYMACPTYEELSQTAIAANQKIYNLQNAMRDVFLLCVSDGEYYVKAKFKTLKQAQDFHSALIPFDSTGLPSVPADTDKANLFERDVEAI